MHYGFPAKLHTDKGANFESKVIKKLCQLAGITKTRMTPYHPMGNGMVERFNKTLLNMMGTLTEDKKGNWAAYVPTLTHAYNAAIHESTGFSPYFLMFGRHPRLAVDAFLGLKENINQKDYADKLRDRLRTAYKKATEEAKKKGVKYKHYYDQKVRKSSLDVGDLVLAKKVGIKGKHKLSDIWEPYTYTVVDQPIPDILVFSVKREGNSTKQKLLHRNMLLPFCGLPVIEESEPEDEVAEKPESEIEESADDSTDSSSDVSEKREAVPRYIIPARRSGQERVRPESDQVTQRQEIQRRPRTRPQRKRKPPDRWQSTDWRVGLRPYTFTVKPEDVAYI